MFSRHFTAESGSTSSGPECSRNIIAAIMAFSSGSLSILPPGAKSPVLQAGGSSRAGCPSSPLYLCTEATRAVQQIGDGRLELWVAGEFDPKPRVHAMFQARFACPTRATDLAPRP